MKISAPKSRVKQLTLFDVDEYLVTQSNGVLNHGRARTAIGAYFEQLTAKTLNGDVHKTDCNCDYCPDISAGGKYYEVKAVGNSGVAFIYAGRLEKDLEFSANHDLYYCIWRHKVETKLAGTVAELKQLLAANTLGYVLVPFQQIYDLCKQQEPEKLNSRYGGSIDNPLYGSGYRFKVKQLGGWVEV